MKMDNKVCILSVEIPPEFAGAGKRALNQASYMALNGNNTFFLTTTPNNHDTHNLNITTIKLPVFYKSKKITGKLLVYFYNPLLFIKLLKIMKKEKYDLIHCIPASSWFALLAILSAKLSNTRVISETTLAGSDDPISIRKTFLGVYKRKIFDLSDLIVNISPLLSEQCEKANIAKDKIYTIPNGVNVKKFTNPSNEEKESLRESFGLSKYDWVFIYVGILRPRKGVKEVVEAFIKFKKQRENCCLILVGPTNKDEENKKYYEELKSIIKKNKVEKHIFFTGEVDNVELWMKASDIFLFASNREGFGNVLIEAMSTGLPVISKKISNITNYIITHENDGLIVENEAGFLNAMFKLTDDVNYYNELSNNAEKTVLKRFSEDVIMDQYYEIYSILLNKQKKRELNKKK